MWTIELAVMAVMIGFNSIFAGYEIALASVGLAPLDTLVKEKRRGAVAAWRMKQNMEGSLAVVQLGITLVATIAAATGGAGAEESIAQKKTETIIASVKKTIHEEEITLDGAVQYNGFVATRQ